MYLLRPTGRFPVGCQDLKYCSNPDRQIAADNHVVGRLYYPAKRQSLVSRVLSPPLTWIRDWHYAKGYVSWGFRNPSTTKEKLLKTAAQNTVYALGLTRLLSGTYNAAPEDRQGAFPVIIFSHGAASMRNTYSIICSEFASRGFVVAAVEHTDGTACCTELASGEWKLLQGLGTGAALEAKCDYRVEECLTMAKVLQAMAAGADISGLSLSGKAAAPSSIFKGLMDIDRMAVMGHSCGGATAAAAVASRGEFKCGIALDPWWPLLPSGSAALKGWQTRGPLLVLGSQDWNTPGKMWCDGPRQEAVFNSCKPQPTSSSVHSDNRSSSSSVLSQPTARGVPVAAVTAASSELGSNGSSGPSWVGGGAIHVVPAGSGHGSFTDLPFLLNPWVTQQLRRLAGAKAVPSPKVDPAVIQDVICWSTHTFLNDHLPLTPDNPASLTHQQRWAARLQQQQQHQPGSSGTTTQAAAPSGVSAPHALSPDGPAAAVGLSPERASSSSRLQGSGGVELGAERADSLVDHLAADENLIVADEQQGHQSNGAAAAAAAAQGGRVVSPPRAHSTDHDQVLEQASDAQLAAAARATHLPVKPLEEGAYRQHLGETAYLVKVYA